MVYKIKKIIYNIIVNKERAIPKGVKNESSRYERKTKESILQY